MDEGQARQLLEKKLRGKYEDETAAPLVRALDYIALAITQAPVCILRRWPRTSPSICHEEHRKSEGKEQSMLYRDHRDLRRVAEATNLVILTWQITFERIQQERRSAARSLWLRAFFIARHSGVDTAKLTLARSWDSMANFDAFARNKMISPRPLLSITGTQAATKWLSDECIAKAEEPKELFVVDGLTYADLYDKVDVAGAKLTEFFTKYLA